MFRISTMNLKSLFVVAALLTATCSNLLVAQDAGGAAALRNLREKNVEAALNALSTAVDQRNGLPELEADFSLPAAAGGIFRAFAQEDAEVRFQLLSKWSLPDGERKTVRLLTTPVPQDAPPQVFARAIGERPRETTFSVADVNGIRGLFCSGWQLVTAAEEAGRLRRLVTDLEELTKQKVVGADTLLLLAQLADNRPDLKSLQEQLTARADALTQTTATTNAYPGTVDADVFAIAAAALKHPELRGISERMLSTLVDSTLKGSSPRLRPVLRVAHATAIQLHRGESGPDALRQNRLKYWIPVTGSNSESSSLGTVPAMWLTHEDHILHLAGDGQDGLLFRYPLSGEFTFQCETQNGGTMGTDGGLAFGGLFFEALGTSSQLTVVDADGEHSLQRPCPFVRNETNPVFTRVAIRHASSTADSPAESRFLVNLHPMWTDQLSGSCPWVGLRGMADKRPVFRNLRFVGSPTIPREVQLTDGAQLRGWLSSFYGETQAVFHAGGTLDLPAGTISAGTTEAVTEEVPVDWSIADGVVTAQKQEATSGRTSQSILRYQRPLLEGESISYEYEYQPDAVEVHPVLGRLALLIEVGGVRIHWLTDGDREWTGLPEDNATLEPLSRRGGREIPLKAGEWNTVTLSRADGKLLLTLNGTLIYERPVDFGGEMQFGLYRDRTRSAVRVRNVVLRGDWPESLPADCVENPVAVGDNAQAAADLQIRNSLLDENILADNVIELREQVAVATSDQQRFELLTRWVLPRPDRPIYRMSGLFTPADLPPPEYSALMFNRDSMVQGHPRRIAALMPVHHRSQSPPIGSGSAELVSPVFDLIDVAEHSGRLEELRTTIEQISTEGDVQRQRDRAALLCLIAVRLHDQEAATRAMEQLFAAMPKEIPTQLSDMWAETLVVWQVLRESEAPGIAGDLISLIHQQRTQRALPSGIEFWHTQIASLLNRHLFIVGGGTSQGFDVAGQNVSWINAVRYRARSCGPGSAEADWMLTNDNELHHLSGHQEEFLLYPSPLSGHFEVTCEVSGYGQSDVLANGLFSGLNSNPGIVNTGSFRGGTFSRAEVSPVFTRPDPWLQHRVTVRDGVCSSYINGRLVRTDAVADPIDPWFGLHAWYR
ncbi:MAG: DUF1583 domain-containing protein, partial [Planctomycetaceae bacterium]|nr:DUF1583 domain-containing protein [Planctomycetaceae bacterium]